MVQKVDGTQEERERGSHHCIKFYAAHMRSALEFVRVREWEYTIRHAGAAD